MKILFLLVFSTSLFYTDGNCRFNSTLTSKQTSIFIFLHKTEVSFWYRDNNYGIHDEVFSARDKDSSVELYITTSVPICLYYSNKAFTPYLIMPNDKIEIHATMDTITSIKCLNNASRDNELFFFNSLINKTAPFLLLLNTKMNSLINNQKEYSEIIYSTQTDLYLKRLLFLKDYSKEKNVSSEFISYVKNYIRYSYLKDILLPTYFWKYKKNKLQYWYINKLDSLKNEFENDSLITMDTYYNSVYNYNQYLVMKEGKDIGSLPLLYQSALANFSSQTKDILLFKIMMDNQNKKSNVYPNYFSKFLIDCNNESFKKEVQEDYNYVQELKDNNKKGFESLLNTTEDNHAILLENILKQNKGKVIYMDFWASWCWPCRNEMKYSFSLQKELSEKQILFMYISMDSQKSNWKNSYKSYNPVMNSSNSFILLKDFQSTFAKKNRISSIPRYMIVDKKGNFVDIDALRPSDQKLKDQLIKLADTNRTN